MEALIQDLKEQLNCSEDASLQISSFIREFHLLNPKISEDQMNLLSIGLISLSKIEDILFVPLTTDDSYVTTVVKLYLKNDILESVPSHLEDVLVFKIIEEFVTKIKSEDLPFRFGVSLIKTIYSGEDLKGRYIEVKYNQVK